MNTRKLLLLCGLGVLTFSAQAQNPRIVLQGSGAPQVFASIDSAMAAAQPNDKLYFSGGTFTASTDLMVDKPLQWIGAGISPDSTNVTAVTTVRVNGGVLTFTTGAGGSTFTGIHFYPQTSNATNQIQYGTSAADDAPQNMVFERCSFECTVILGIPLSSNGPDPNPPGSSSSFNECLFYSTVLGRGITSTTFTRCDFGWYIDQFQPSGLYMDHCIVRKYLQNSASFMVKNSVFPENAALTQNSGTMNNCLFFGSYVGNNVSTSNCFFDQTSIFVDDANPGDFLWSDDLHLASGSPGIGAADDGTNIGIYGSPSPFKAGAVPYNPHYRQATIAGSTNPNGDLPVNIRVVAQPN